MTYKGVRHIVMYAYRLKEDPHEWRYCIEEVRALDELGAIIAAMGAGSHTPRIVYPCFRDGMDAMSFFSDIPLNGDRAHVKNKTLLSEAKDVEPGPPVINSLNV